MIRPTMEGEVGVAWLKILVAFEAHGDKLETPVAHRLPGDRARLAKTARQLLVDLKALTEFVLETCVGPTDLYLFASANTTGSRLRAIGIQHSMPSISMIPIWSSTAAQIFTEGLLRQKGRLARAMKVSHGEGVLRLKWSNMSVKGIPSWRPSLIRELWPILQQD